jgi:hypothetical protein
VRALFRNLSSASIAASHFGCRRQASMFVPARLGPGGILKQPFFIRVAAILLLVLPGIAAAEAHLAFATLEQGQAALSARDDFVARLSPFDRAARLKTDRDVSEQEYLSFVRASVLAWQDDGEKRRVAQAMSEVEKDFSDLGIALPDVRIVRTSGKEEGGAAYTRGKIIVLSTYVLDDRKQDLTEVISHELFHIISRNDVALRDALYRSIGFERCAEFSLPPALLPRRITNPDAPRNDHCIRVDYHGKPVWATPVLYADRDRYDVKKGGAFFDYLQFKLALTDSSGPTDSGPPVTANAGSRLVDVGDVRGFYEQVGKNTDYIIHPEEILAENFAFLVTKKKDLPSPKIPAAMLKIFKAAR